MRYRTYKLQTAIQMTKHNADEEYPTQLLFLKANTFVISMTSLSLFPCSFDDTHPQICFSTTNFKHPFLIFRLLLFFHIYFFISISFFYPSFFLIDKKTTKNSFIIK